MNRYLKLSELLKQKSLLLVDLDGVLNTENKDSYFKYKNIMNLYVKIMTYRKNTKTPFLKCCEQYGLSAEQIQEIINTYNIVHPLNNAIYNDIKKLHNSGYILILASDNSYEICNNFLVSNSINIFDSINCPETNGMLWKTNKLCFMRLFSKYSVSPSDCWLMDDNEDNIEIINKLGGNGKLI